MEENKTVETMLNDEIIRQLESDDCTDDQKLATISRLCDLKNKEIRLRLEKEEQNLRNEREEKCAVQKHKDFVIDSLIKTTLTAAEIAIPMVFYAVWMKRGFEFEKNGSYTSSTFRTLWNRFRPTK